MFVLKKIFCLREYSNISLFRDKEAWFSLLIWILKSYRITVLIDVKDSKIEDRSAKKLHRLDEGER